MVDHYRSKKTILKCLHLDSIQSKSLKTKRLRICFPFMVTNRLQSGKKSLLRIGDIHRFSVEILHVKYIYF